MDQLRTALQVEPPYSLLMIVLLFGNGQNLDLQNTVPRLRFDIVLPLLWPGMISLVSALPGAASYHKTRLPLEGGDVFVRPAVKCRKIARMGQRRSTRQPPAILTSYAGLLAVAVTFAFLPNCCPSSKIDAV